jgi:hypothetical protein
MGRRARRSLSGRVREAWREITLAARGLNVLIETPEKSA